MQRRRPTELDKSVDGEDAVAAVADAERHAPHAGQWCQGGVSQGKRRGSSVGQRGVGPTGVVDGRPLSSEAGVV